jgi:excisionase family DNA binding protein
MGHATSPGSIYDPVVSVVAVVVIAAEPAPRPGAVRATSSSPSRGLTRPSSTRVDRGSAQLPPSSRKRRRDGNGTVRDPGRNLEKSAEPERKRERERDGVSHDRAPIDRKEPVMPPSRPAQLPLVGIEAIAAHLGVSVRHVRRLVSERRIPFVKWAQRLHFDVAAVDAWVDQHRIEPEAS